MSCTKLGKEVNKLGEEEHQAKQMEHRSGMYVQDAFKASFWCNCWCHGMCCTEGAGVHTMFDLRAALCRVPDIVVETDMGAIRGFEPVIFQDTMMGCLGLLDCLDVHEAPYAL